MMRRYCQRKADIAFRLGVHPDQVTTDHVWEYEMGHLDDGAASSLWLRTYIREPVLSIQPYTVSPTLYAAVREPFPDDAQWPSPLPSLLTDGSAPNE